MALPRFFRTKQPNSFNYQPLYWDPDREAREDRINRIKKELGYDLPVSSKKSTAITRGSFRQYNSKVKVKASRESNRRIFILVAFLLMVAYLLLYR